MNRALGQFAQFPPNAPTYPICPMEWVPVGFITLKALVFCATMFFAIKWHYEQGQGLSRRALLLTAGKVAAIFILVLAAVLLLTFGVAQALGMELTLP